MFSYPDAARYRLGPNYQQLPNNRPIAKVYSPYERDGPGRIDGNYGGDPNYVRSEFRPMTFSKRYQFPNHEQWQGHVVIKSTEVTDRDFVQPRELWEIIKKEKAVDEFLENFKPMIAGVEGRLREQVFGKMISRKTFQGFAAC